MHAVVRTVLVALLGLAVHASAESRVCIGGDLDHLSESQKNACWASAEQVRSDATKFGAPADWHFFVVCTESDWKVYSAFSKRTAMRLAVAGADTDLQKRTTFFRGASLQSANAVDVNKIVAREVASAVSQSTDETIIQKQVALWIPDTGLKVLVLRASR